MFHQLTRDDISRQGLGVGLGLVRKMVELHQGRVDARSAGAGKGTVFIVRVPLVAAPFTRLKGDAAALRPKSGSGTLALDAPAEPQRAVREFGSERFSHLRADAGRSILSPQTLIMVVVAFADYLLDEVEMYAEGLRTFDVRVVPVIGDVAIQAANTIANTACDAVITRILPRHFGIELVRALRADEKTAHLPALVITSLPQPPLHEAARAAGATEVLLLPQTPEQLARAIRRLIRHRPAA